MNISNTSQALAYQGMQTGFERLAKHAEQIANPNSGDVTEPLLGQMFDKTLVEVNAKSLKSADDRIGTLLDIMA